MIPTRMHGMLDYVIIAALIAAPWVFGFAHGGPETWLPLGVAAASFAYSLMTNYEMGLLGALPMKAHLAIDVVAGLFLASSPWFFHFAERVYQPHLACGIFVVVASALTSRHPLWPALIHRPKQNFGYPEGH